MARAEDVASYILEKKGRMSTLKLQKLLYYSKAWSLVWDGRPLFEDRIEAWMNGPVVVDIFHEHKGRFNVDKSDFHGVLSNIALDQRKSIDAVLESYSDMDGADLAALSHGESPWIEARKNLSPGERGNNEITNEAMYNYYAALK